MILAAMDIGSNASRIIISESVSNKGGAVELVKLNFLRIPMRLGTSVFEYGKISNENINRLTECFQLFRAMMNLYQVDQYRACATSAFRDAENSKEVVSLLFQLTGITLEVIDGDEEAAIIYENHIEKLIDEKKNYLYIDVGGGSTEIALIQNGNFIFRKSFDIGTIRLLNKTISRRQWEKFKKEILTLTQKIKVIEGIGTGGSINKIGTIQKSKGVGPYELGNLKLAIKELKSLSIEERMHKFEMKRDKADLIVPGLKIYASVMEWAGIEKIYVPKVGLVDGILKQLVVKYM
ncbi:MAG TPA: exopolyphosphatase [Edaphocola sp.]|nr:exopolyphosphatase [Edaphocola sp.]